MDLPNDRMLYDYSFNVSIKNGQEKLAKFLAFITHIDKNE